MAARYWRLVGISARQGGELALSGAFLWVGGVLDATAVSCTISPQSGSVVDLSNFSNVTPVVWSSGVVNAPGFALVWDTGSDSTTSVGVKLRAAADEATYPRNLLLQSSQDAITWMSERPSHNLLFPGAFGLSEFKSGYDYDPYTSSVALQLDCDGVNGATTIVDAAPNPKTVSFFGNAQVSTASPKFGSACLLFDGSGDYLKVGSAADWAFLHNGTAWTFEAWIKPVNFSTSYAIINTTATSGEHGMIVYIDTEGKILVQIYRGVTLSFVLIGISTGSIPLDGAYHHIAVCLDMVPATGNASIFIDGIKVGSIDKTGASPSGSAPTNTLTIGAFAMSLASGNLNGRLDEIRITNGVARYASNFIPPTSSFSVGGDGLDLKTAPGEHYATAPAGRVAMVAGAEYPISVLQLEGRTAMPSDGVYAGPGKIVGTVFEKATPSNLAVHRKVRLIDERSSLCVQETWSDPSSGAYQFVGVPLDTRYTIVAYDHTGAYRGVIADGQFAERMQ